MGSERDDALESLASFVESAIQIDSATRWSTTLAEKLDVLERVIELLRLRTGKVVNSLRVDELLANGLSVSTAPGGGSVLTVGGRPLTASRWQT